MQRIRQTSRRLKEKGVVMTINVRVFTLTTTNGTKLGKFIQLDELGDAFVAHFGKGYRSLADKLVTALKSGADTSRLETVLGVHVTSEYAELAA